MTFRLALIGFGGVNQGLVALLKAKQGKLNGLDFRITALADLRLGVVSNPQGIDLDALLATADSGFSTDALRSDPSTRISEHIDLAALSLAAAGLGFLAAPPPGAMYLFFKVAGFSGDSLAFAKRLVAEAGLGIAPGVAFGPEGEGYLRWCFAASDALLLQGAERLRTFLKSALAA